MKKIVIFFILSLSLWAEDKPKNIYSLDTFEESSSYKAKVDELSLKKSDLALLKASSSEKDSYAKEETLILEKSLSDILDILDDNNFKKEYNLTELTLFIYHENRALMEFCHAANSGSFCQKKLVILEEKILKRKALGVIYACYASSDFEGFDEKISDDYNYTQFWNNRFKWENDIFLEEKLKYEGKI